MAATRLCHVIAPRGQSHKSMAPKKKGGGKAETPEQLAARRAAAMAMFNTSSTPKEPPKAAPPLPKASSAAPAVAAETAAANKQMEALEIGDAEPKQAVGSSPGKTLGGMAVALPDAAAGWVKLLVIEPTPAMAKNAKKQGEVQIVQNECKVFNLKDVAYLYDAEGRTNAACWRTKLEGANLGTGSQPKVRYVGEKTKALIGKNNLMLNALQTHSEATLSMYPSGHVAVDGPDDSVNTAVALIDNLVDGDGAETKEALAALLVEAEPWGGVLELPCPDEWVGAVIGKGGARLKAIALESGALIDYVDPEQIEEQKAAKGGEEAVEAKAAATEAVDVGDGADASKPPAGFFRIRGKFENQCRLAAKRIEERLTLAQKLDVHGYVMVPRGSVGRLIGKGGSNIKLLQRTSGASRITFDKEPGGRATTQACTVIAADIEAAVVAAKVILEAVPIDSTEARAELQKRLEDWPAHVLALQGGDTPPVDATRETAVEAHRAKFGTACLSADMQTKANPADLAAVDFECWLLQYGNAEQRVHSDGGGRR